MAEQYSFEDDDNDTEPMRLRIFTDRSDPGYVMLELEGVTGALTGAEARQVADALFRAGCDVDAAL